MSRLEEKKPTFEEMAADYPSFEDYMRESVQSGRLGEMLDEWRLRASGVARDVQRLRRVRKFGRKKCKEKNGK